MKFVRYGNPGAEKPGMIDVNGRIRDLSDHIDDFAGTSLEPDRLARLAKLDTETLPLVGNDIRIGAPVGNIRQLVCIGLNYTDHAAELGMPLPSEPVIFMKSPYALTGPFDDIAIPPGSKKTDWEIELTIVIGRRAEEIDRADAMSYVAGFTIMNDLSERAWQLEGTGQWTKGKSYRGFAPLGPWLVTPDDIADVHHLHMWLDVDGQRMQEGNTKTMIFDVGHMVAFVSRHLTLMPGDIIATGTPPGVGSGKKPPKFLKPGQNLTFGIEALGEQRHTMTGG
ncbi:MAG: fumarylacetoacetate hydrolase family protein [Rhodospirillales bacterium]